MRPVFSSIFSKMNKLILLITYQEHICHRYSTAKPSTGGKNKTKGDPYETHSYCRKCGGVWMPKSVIVKGIRCPCCNQRVANKSRSSKARGNEKKVYL